MATKTANGEGEVPLPVAVLAVLLIIAFALGQANLGDGGSGGDDESGPGSSWNPCPKGKPYRHLVESWTIGGKTFKLFCGNNKAGWRKIAEKHKGKDKRTLECIEKVLQSSGKPNPRGKNDEYMIRFANSQRGNALAKVAVVRRTGEIVSAYVRRGEWADCVR